MSNDEERLRIFMDRRESDMSELRRLLLLKESSNASLFLAARLGLVDVVQEMVERGANVNNETQSVGGDFVGETPLTAASQGGHAEIVQLLLQRGAYVNASRVNMRSRLIQSSLTLACQSGSLESVRLLLKAGANVNGNDDRPRMCQRPLVTAAIRENAAMVQILLQYNANVNDMSQISSELCEITDYDEAQEVTARLVMERSVKLSYLLVAPTIFEWNADSLGRMLPAFENNITDAVASISKLLCHDRRYEEEDMKVGLESVLSSKHIQDPLRVLCNIRRWVLEGLRDEHLTDLLVHLFPLVPPGAQGAYTTRATRTLSAKQARWILANMFVGNCNDPMAIYKDDWNTGGLDIRELLHGSQYDKTGIAKLECLLVYFETSGALEGTAEDDRRVTFERLCFPAFRMPESTTERFVGQGVVIHDGTMESPTRTADAFVNFANSNFGYGKLVRSCTQEEILLMCCPELLVGMVFIGRMRHGEVINVHGLRRFVAYSGYLDTFACLGPYGRPSPCIQTIMTMDACYDDHFADPMIVRDVSKAFHAFAALSGAAKVDHHAESVYPVITTGKWGCGVFGGLPPHKFLQQVLAANMAGVDLEFACFGDRDRCDELLSALHERQPAAGEIVQLLHECRNPTSFVEDAISFLQHL